MLQPGSTFFASSEDVSAAAENALFEPLTDEWAWACYEFTVDDLEQPFTVHLKWDQPPETGQTFIGVANWEKDWWEFETSDVIAPSMPFVMPGNSIEYIDPLAHLSLVVVITDSPDSAQLANIEVGTMPWEFYQHTWGGWDMEFVNDTCMDDEGNIYIIGETWTFDAGFNDLMLMKLTPQNELAWTKTYGTPGRETGMGVAFYDGYVFTCGNVRPDGQDNFDIFIQKWNPDGTLLTSKCWSGEKEDRAAAIYVDAAGLHICGQTYSLGEMRSDCDSLLLNMDFGCNLLSAYTWGDTEKNDTAYCIEATELQVEDFKFTCIGGSGYGYVEEGWDPTVTICSRSDLDTTAVVFREPSLSDCSFKTLVRGSSPQGIVLGGYKVADTKITAILISGIIGNDEEPPITTEICKEFSVADPYNMDITSLAYSGDTLIIGGNIGYTAFPDIEWYPMLMFYDGNTWPTHVGAWGDGDPDNALRTIESKSDGGVFWAGTTFGPGEHFHRSTFTPSDLVYGNGSKPTLVEVQETYALEPITEDVLEMDCTVQDRTAAFEASLDKLTGNNVVVGGNVYDFGFDSH